MPVPNSNDQKTDVMTQEITTKKSRKVFSNYLYDINTCGLYHFCHDYNAVLIINIKYGTINGT
jgi:hypothetical protein